MGQYTHITKGQTDQELREALLLAAKGACGTGSLFNCHLFVQTVTGVANLRSIPVVRGKIQVGDVIQWGDNPARHWAISLGGDAIIEVPEWGAPMQKGSLRDVNDEYGTPDVIRRPDWARPNRVAKTFELNVGDPVLMGKYKNSPGRIEGFSDNGKGDPTVKVRKKPKGEGQGSLKEVNLFKVRYDDDQAKKDKTEKTASRAVRDLAQRYIQAAMHKVTLGTVVAVQDGQLFGKTLYYVKRSRDWQRVNLHTFRGLTSGTLVNETMADREIQRANQEGRVSLAVEGITRGQIKHPVHLTALDEGALIHHPYYGTTDQKVRGKWETIEVSPDRPSDLPAPSMKDEDYSGAIDVRPGLFVGKLRLGATNERQAFEHPTEDARKKYMEEHPGADPKKHTVQDGGSSEGPKAVLKKKKLREKAQGAIRGVGSKIVDLVKAEVGEWRAAGRGIKKLFQREPLEPEEKRQVINYAIHQSMMLGLKGAIYSLIPPPPGMAVKQAISTAAFRLIDKALGQRFSGVKVGSVEAEFTKLIEESLSQAVDEVLSKYDDESQATGSKGQKKEALDRLSQRYLQATLVRTAGIFQPPPKMVDAVAEWVLAQVAATKITEIQAEIRHQQKENQEFLKSPLALRFTQSIVDLRGILPTGGTQALYQAYKVFWDASLSLFGYLIPQYKQRDFSQLDKRRGEVTQKVLRAIQEAEESFQFRNENRAWVESQESRIKGFKAYKKPGVKPMKGDTATAEFPLDLSDWYISQDLVADLRERKITKFKEQVESAPNPDGEIGKLVQEVMTNLQREWTTLKVVLKLDLTVTNARAYWQPLPPLVVVKYPSSSFPGQVSQELWGTVEHELRHFGQSLLAEVYEVGDPYFIGRLPQPGMPSRHIKTPQYKQVHDAPTQQRRQPGVPTRDELHHLDDVEFYTDLADAIRSIRRVLDDRLERSPDFSVEDQKAVFLRLVGGKVDRKTSDRLHLRYLDTDHFFLTLKKYAQGKWKKAVSEAWKALRIDSATRLAQGYMLASMQPIRRKLANPALPGDYHTKLQVFRDKVTYNKARGLENTSELWVAWRLFYTTAKQWAAYVIDHLALPAKAAKPVEMAVRLFAKTYGSGKGPPDIIKWFDQNEARFDLLDQARTWPERSEESGLFTVGPFTVHDTIQAAPKERAAAEAIIERAVKEARSSGVPGFAQMAYGQLYLVGQIGRKNWAAWYMPAKDTIYLRPGVRGSSVEESARHLLHELGHRFWAKKLDRGTKTAWVTHHSDMTWTKPDRRLPEVGEVLVPLVNNKKVKVDSYEPGKAVLVEVTTGELVGKVDKFKLTEWVQGASHKMSFPSLYAATDAQEHFCESLSLYCQGRLKGDNLAAFEKIVLGVEPRMAARLASRFLAAGLQSDLQGRMTRLLQHFTSAEAKAVGEWFAANFRFQSPQTPKGQKTLKDQAEKLRWWLVAGSMHQEGAQQREVDRVWSEEVKPQLANLVRYFSDEGGTLVPREMAVGNRLYLNKIGFEQSKFVQYVTGLEKLFDTVHGWRAKAFVGTLKVALAGPKDFRGTAGGVYKSGEDTLYVRATPAVLKRTGGTYGAPDYILIHELGHRYERKVRVPEDFDKSSWWTGAYSRKEGESFAELFALGHFKMTRDSRGAWDPSIQDRFEAVMSGSKAQSRPELPPHLQGIGQPGWSRSAARLAAKFKDKKEVPKAEGKGTTTVYEYSERQVALRNSEKAKRVEKLRGNLHKLQAQVKKDLKSDDPHTRLCALAVGLMNDTYERVGNDESAKDGHVGVTGWSPEHIKFGDGKATITYVGKSGVEQKKVTKDADLIRVMKEAVKDKSKGDTIFTYEDGRVDASAVNEYLDDLGFDITAKDIRGLHANREMQDRLKAVRSKGGKLPTDKKKRDKKLKDEFEEALEGAAEAVGHEPATLKSQYLVPGLEDTYLKDGTVMDKLHEKKGYLSPQEDRMVRRVAARYLSATKTPAQKEDKDVRQMLKGEPKKKPPREDLRRNRMRTEDADLAGEGDKDLSLNFKKVAADLLAEKWVRRLMGAEAPSPPPKPEEPEHKPGDTWQSEDKKWVAKNPDGNVHTFGDSDEAKAQAEAFAKGEDAGEGAEDKPEGDKPKEKTPGQEKADRTRALKKHVRVQRDKLDEQFNDIIGKLPPKQAAKLRALMGQAEGSAALKAAEKAVEKAQAEVDDIEAGLDHEKADELRQKVYDARLEGDADAGKAAQKELDELEKDLKSAQNRLTLASKDAQRIQRQEAKGAKGSKEKFLNEVAAALEAAESAAVAELGDKGIGAGMMAEAAKDPFKNLNWEDPAAVAQALVQQNLNDKVLLNPAFVGGHPLSKSPLDSDKLTDRAEQAFNQFSSVKDKAGAALRKKAAESAVQQLAEMDPEGHEAKELNRIIDGIHAAMEMNGEKWDLTDAEGKLVREPLDEKMGLLFRQMVHQGDVRILLTDSTDHKAAREAVRDAMGRLSDGELQEMSKDTPWAPIGDLLGGIGGMTLDPEVAELLRGLVRDLSINNMTTNQGIINAVAGKKIPTSNPLEAYIEAEKEHQPENLKGAIKSFLDCIKEAKDPMDCSDQAEAVKRTQVDEMAARLEKAAKAGGVEPDPQDPHVAAVRHVVETGDMSVLDADLKPEKSVAEQKTDWLRSVTDPEERKRIQEMTPDEFQAMQAAILGEDAVSPQGKTASSRKLR